MFVKIEGLKVFYPGMDSPSLTIDNLEIKEGEFVLITGKSGSGKSTLLNLLNGVIPHFVEATVEGKVYVFDREVQKYSIPEISSLIGTLLQDPDSQILNYKVIDEIAFGIENLKLEREEIRKRIFEVCKEVDICNLLERDTSKLSGGEKQRVVLASILAMRPKALILDEPTSSIDIKGTREILTKLREFKGKLSMIIAEHKISKVINFVDRIIILDKGRILYNLQRDQVNSIIDKFDDLGLEPLSIRKTVVRRKGERTLEGKIIVRDDNREILNTDIVIYKGITALMGDNGSGKSTLLKAIAGILPRGLKFSGYIRVEGKEISKLPPEDRGEFLAYLPQDIDLFFTKRTVREEISYMMRLRRRYDDKLIDKLLREFELPPDSDPFLLSVGQKRRLAIASLLASGVKIFLLDEPTTGQDWYNRKMLGEELRNLDGSFVVATHDPKFVYLYADRVLEIRDGRIREVNPEALEL
ncbi:ABC transporter ATP-binding protein [Acidianus ambivalens]|uniref:ATP-binding cassette domain-containing protein n=1 Tax=Acidianus ambivalens TaxID=2283 RepID=A0A650CUW5_ACIAM|nr:ABC transporter ATP-binding protein [Acidianus ambivalens]MQL55757.1 ATP-binding cassette domain-containing protein [Acidianus ambivalens]QGR21671.1 ATP-binding cassette domain-containing protein [Acidianus ambivalens]